MSHIARGNQFPVRPVQLPLIHWTHFKTMGESHKEWIEHRKVFRSLDAADREMNDREHQDSSSENNRRYETYSRALRHRETPSSSERENTPATPPGWVSLKKKRSNDHNQGSRFKGEHQNDRGYKATTGECVRLKSSETGSSTSSGGNQGGSGKSDTHDEKKGNGFHGYQGPAYFDSDSDSDSYSDSDSDAKDGKDEDDHDNDDYGNDGNYDD
ncbi:hypothetical protein F4860DRAFT_509312 [Xylaria cubensis]|nr:hypothetical protein F4860DRAFT_509312 [Xylaria cubensis]